MDNLSVTDEKWAIFCHIIDNYGDIGFCWRLTKQLAQTGRHILLFVNGDKNLIKALAPRQLDMNIQIFDWENIQLRTHIPVDVVIETFGCTLPLVYQVQISHQLRQPIWINLEYLSAEDYTLRCHGLPSPVLTGPTKGLTKWFYYPGFTPASGGLLATQAHEQSTSKQSFFSPKEHLAPDFQVLLFCYESTQIPNLLSHLCALDCSITVWVCHGQSAQTVQALNTHNNWDLQYEWPPTLNAGSRSRKTLRFLPFLAQETFDQLIGQCDLCIVRGEDSFIRALVSGKPFIWHIYPQSDGAHLLKLKAFLEWSLAPALVRRIHEAWNSSIVTSLPFISTDEWKQWCDWIQQLQSRLLGQTDLLSRLITFVNSKKLK